MKKIPSIQVIFFLLLFCCTCSTPTGYKLLSFFIDGVPEPEAGEMVEVVDSLDGEPVDSVNTKGLTLARMEYWLHAPYRDKDCMKCHNRDSYGDVLMPEPGLCYACHSDYSEKNEYLHGPVDFGFCTSCHEPHMSKTDNLLKEKGSGLCYLCHMINEVMESRSHSRTSGKSCIACHDPHGSNNKNLLLPGDVRSSL